MPNDTLTAWIVWFHQQFYRHIPYVPEDIQ